MASQDWFDKDFYAILGVSKDASDADIKKAYRKLARKYHPDQNPGDAAAEAKFKELSEAHSVLADPEERKEYDAIRAMGSGARFTAPGGGGGAGGFEDVFGNMFGGAGRGGGTQYTFRQGGGGDYDDLLGGLFGSGRFGQTTGGYRGFGGPTKGRDVSASTTLDFITATQGDRITLQTSEGREITVNGAGRRRRRPEDPPARQGSSVRPTAASPATSCSPSRFASTRSSSATGSTSASRCR